MIRALCIGFGGAPLVLGILAEIAGHRSIAAFVCMIVSGLLFVIYQEGK